MNNILDFLFKKINKNYVARTTESKPTFRENRSSYIAKNPNKKELLKLVIDGGICKSQSSKKCDKGLYVLPDDKIFLIELKGCDIETAFKQLFSSYTWLDNMNNNSHRINYYIRFVYTRGCKMARFQHYIKKFKKKGVLDIKYHERIMDIDII